MQNPLSAADPTIYKFDPTVEPNELETQRYIVLGEGSEEDAVISVETLKPIGETDQLLDAANQSHQWSTLVQAILTPDYVDQFVETLRDRSPLPELVTHQLFQHLLKVYQHKVELLIQAQGIEAIDTRSPHLKLVNSRKGGKRLEFIFDDEQIKAYLHQSLAKFFTHAGFWQELALSLIHI
jgi:hypothetical protein